MIMAVERRYKLHVFIFVLLSIHLFILIPVAFISKFLAVATCIAVLLNIKTIKFEFDHWRELIVYVICNVYLTFAIFGYDLFLDNENALTIARLTISVDYYQHLLGIDNGVNIFTKVVNLFYFGLCFIWTGYILQFFLNIQKLLLEVKNRLCMASGGGYWKKWLILFIIMSVMFMIWLLAFNPIAMSQDSWDYIDGWRTGTYNSFRSPVYSFLIFIICSIAPTRPEVQWVAIAQIFAFSASLATILMYFHKKWIRFKYILPAAVFLPLIPSFGLHTIVIWCDLANGMSMLWFTYVLVRIIDEMLIHDLANRRQRVSLYIQLCISMVLVYFIRSNSFLVYIIVVPVLVFVFLLRKQWKLFVTVLLSAVLVVLIRFPGYNALNVPRYSWGDQIKYYAAIHDIQGTYYAGGKLSEQTQASLKKYVTNLDRPDAKDIFIPDTVLWYSDYYAYNLSGITLGEFFSMYLDSFIHNPFKMLKSMLHRVRAYWVIDAKGHINLINYIGIYDPSANFTGTQAADLGINRQPNFLTKIMDLYIGGIAVFPVLSMFVWRFGIWTALMIISITTLILKKRYIYLLTYLPVFVYLASLVLSMGWTDYRYGLPVFFTGLFLPLALFLLHPANADEEYVK